MDTTLTALGLNKKEASFYIALLEKRPMSASSIAKLMQESRTNTYMVLERLETLGLVTTDDSQPVRRYQVEPPEKLQKLLEHKEKELQSTRSDLGSIIGELKSLYVLGQHKPGVSYLQGIDGYRKMLEGCAQSSEEILIIGSIDAPDNPAYWNVLQMGLAKRKARGIKSKLILHTDARETSVREEYAKRGQEVRFWGRQPFHGEVVVYEDKLIMTVYEPKLINVILTNSIIANTMKAIFNQIWDEAAIVPKTNS